MKTNEFVKVFGWDYTRGIIIACDSGFLPRNNNHNDLKRIIESHDYIESLGGYQFVKENLPSGYFGDGDYKDLIQKCLEDMESCQ